jgi:hypothetical protein
MLKNFIVVVLVTFMQQIVIKQLKQERNTFKTVD